MNAPLPENETERLAALRGYQILDTPPDTEFDLLTALNHRGFGAIAQRRRRLLLHQTAITD